MSWKEIKFGDVVTLRQGFALNSKSSHYISDESGLPLLKISDLLNNRETLFVKKEIPKQFLVFEDEIIYTRTAQVGYAFMGKRGVIYNNCFKVIPNEEKINKIFLYKVLNTAAIRNYAQTLATGTAQLDLNHDSFKSIKIKMPSLDIQQKIVNLISNYDNLIENNNKRIKLLENMAEELYKEWFVRFRFPNYKNTKIVDGIPDGWRKDKLSTLSFITDGTHDSPKETTSEDSYFLVTGKHLINNQIDFLNTYKISKEDHLKVMQRSGLKSGDILFSNIGTIGSVAMVGDFYDFSCKNVLIFKSEKNNKSFIYEFLKYPKNKELFLLQSNGASQKFLSLEYIRNFKTLIPSNELIKEFEEILNPFYKEINILVLKKQNLKQTRDLLLPRLISGKLDIEDLEIV